MKSEDEKVIGKFSEALEMLEEGRANMLTEILDIQAIVRSAEQNEVKRLEKKLGQLHPRTLLMKERLRSQLKVIEVLEQEKEISRIKVLPISKDETIIDGRIMDEKGRGIMGLNISISNTQGERIAEFGEACTNESGYYALKIPTGVVEEAVKTNEKGVLVRVASQEERQLQTSSEPMKLKPGKRLTSLVTMNRSIFRAPVSPATPKRKVRTKASSASKETVVSSLATKSKQMESSEENSDAETFVLEGRVVDSSGSGLAGWIVTAKDERGIRLIEQITEHAGYFRMVLFIKRETGEESTTLRRKRPKTRFSRNRRVEAKEQIMPGSHIKLQISDKRGAVFYQDKQSQVVTPGVVRYREIVIDEHT